MFLYCSVHVYLFLFVLSALVLELLPSSENSIAVIIIIIIITKYAKPSALKRQTNGTHTCPSQCMKREMSQCCGISSTHRHRSYSK